MKRFFITSLALAAVVLGLLAFIIIQLKECASGVIPKFSHIPNGVYSIDSIGINPAAVLTVSFARAYCRMSYVEETHLGSYNIPGTTADKGFNFRGPVVAALGYDLAQGKKYLSPDALFYVNEDSLGKVITLRTKFMPVSIGQISVEAYTENDDSWFSGEIDQDTAFEYIIKPICRQRITAKIREDPLKAEEIVENAKNAIAMNIRVMLDVRMQNEPYRFRVEFNNQPFSTGAFQDNQIPTVELDPIIEELAVPVQAEQKINETLSNWKRRIQDAFK